MRSVEARFKGFAQASPGHSSFIVFSKTIQGQKFTHRIISVHFNKLVEKVDYSQSDKKRLLRHLRQVSLSPKQAEDSTFRGQKGVLSPLNGKHALVHA